MKISTIISLVAFSIGVSCITIGVVFAKIRVKSGESSDIFIWVILLGLLLVIAGFIGLFVALVKWLIVKWSKTREKKAEQAFEQVKTAAGVAEIDYSQNLRDLPVGWEMMMPAIRSTMLITRAITGAIRLLLCWGVINFGIWLISYNGDSMKILKNLNSAHGGLGGFIYGGAIIAFMQLFFGVVGALRRNPAVIQLDGISILAVGVFNLFHDTWLESSIQPYGYHLETGNPFAVLGLCQLGWGCKQLWRARKMVDGDSKAELDDKAKETMSQMKQHLLAPANPLLGRLNGTLHDVVNSKMTHYLGHFVMWLQPEKAVCFQAGFNKWFVFDRPQRTGEQLVGEAVQFKKDGVVQVVAYDGSIWALTFGAPYLAGFKDWLRSGTKQPADDKTGATNIEGKIKER